MSNFAAWKRDTQDVLERHIEDKAAVACALSLMSGSKVVFRILSGDIDEDVKQGVADLYVQQSILLPLNPFWQARGAHIGPVLTAATLGWFDSLSYVADGVRADDFETKVRVMTLKSLNYEIATSVMLAVKGGAALSGATKKLRDDLIAVDIKHKM